MRVNPQTPASPAERPALRLLEKPQRPLRQTPPAKAPLAGWRHRLERLAGLIGG